MTMFIEIESGICPYCGNVGIRVNADDLWMFDTLGVIEVQCTKCGKSGYVIKGVKCVDGE